ncbi:MAG TPA: SDR family NAD(P)-dependent oxidoreductase [Vicinamibacteria bacterium]|nr:SDR family NAD(P)-dependent oxidoreductase [Vicinamibacteria bacterium]
MSLSGRRALVTGGGRGIGRAVALDLARAGVAVAVAARTPGDVEAVAAEARRAGGRALAVAMDVSDPASVRAGFSSARAALGGIDILVRGAGVAPTAPLARTSDEVWRQALETNLSGCFYCLREALPEMAARGWGRVVNLASIAGKTGYPYVGAYAASKHGVLGLTRCAALEVATQGVTVNAVCPGYVDTPMLDQGVARIVEKTGLSAEEARRRLADMSPQKRLYTAEEVSALVLFLCGDAAAGINGQALSVDGGTVV